jgi:hypothetical protein
MSFDELWNRLLGKECGCYEGFGLEHNRKFIYRLLPHLLSWLLVIKPL